MKALRNPYVITLLVAVALVLGYYRFRTTPVAAPAPVVKPERPVIVGPDASVELDQLGWTPSPARDPFDAAVRLAAPTPDHETQPVVVDVLDLKAVWLQEKGGWAVINGKVVGEGDTIRDFRVEKISADGVWVQGPGGTRRVGFKPASAPVRPSLAGAASAVGKGPLKPTPGKPLTVAQDTTAATGQLNIPEKSNP